MQTSRKQIAVTTRDHYQLLFHSCREIWDRSTPPSATSHHLSTRAQNSLHYNTVQSHTSPLPFVAQRPSCPSISSITAKTRSVNTHDFADRYIGDLTFSLVARFYPHTGGMLQSRHSIQSHSTCLGGSSTAPAKAGWHSSTLHIENWTTELSRIVADSLYSPYLSVSFGLRIHGPRLSVT